MESNDNDKSKFLGEYYLRIIMVLFFSLLQISVVRAQSFIQSNEETGQELDWNAETTNKKSLTKEEKELAEQTAESWEKWDKANPSESSVIIYKQEYSEEGNKIKSPNEILMNMLVGNWEGFYGGSKAYINFAENKTVVINTSVFSNVPSASGREHIQLYYEIDASKSPYRLIFYNRDKEIKGVFRINDTNSITICHNFNNDEQPGEIDSKYAVINFSKVEVEKEEQGK